MSRPFLGTVRWLDEYCSAFRSADQVLIHGGVCDESSRFSREKRCTACQACACGRGHDRRVTAIISIHPLSLSLSIA